MGLELLPGGGQGRSAGAHSRRRRCCGALGGRLCPFFRLSPWRVPGPRIWPPFSCRAATTRVSFPPTERVSWIRWGPTLDPNINRIPATSSWRKAQWGWAGQRPLPPRRRLAAPSEGEWGRPAFPQPGTWTACCRAACPAPSRIFEKTLWGGG